MSIQSFRKRDKLAIVGFATSSREFVPYDDDTFDIASLNEAYSFVKRFDVWFEMHSRELYYETYSPDNPRTKGHLDWLKAQTKPVFMTQRYDDIPASVAYPYEEMARIFGLSYFTNSIAFMLAWAIAEDYQEIHVYGVDMLMGDEYAYQRACCDFYLGIAIGRGKKVYVPPQSALLKSSYLYGKEPDPVEGVLSESMLINRIGAYQNAAGQKSAELNQAIGAGQELNNLLTALRHGKLGGAIQMGGPPPEGTSTAPFQLATQPQITEPSANGQAEPAQAEEAKTVALAKVS